MGRNNRNTQRTSKGQRRRARRAGTRPNGSPVWLGKRAKPRPTPAEPTDVPATRTCAGVDDDQCTAKILIGDGYKRCRSCQTAWLGSR
jgi:hypothetical protein